MITFNPGPSQLAPETKQDIHAALDKHLLQVSHRAPIFSEISEKAIEGIRKYFKIPADYKIFYTTSATDAMKLSIENCCEKKSFHFINGSFSNLYAKIANSLHKDVITDEVEWGTQNDYQNTKVPTDCDFITVTHNETSTGVMATDEDVKAVKEKNPNAILAVDITSSAGGVDIDISNADIWCFSVQKCLGLPAGLGLIFVSPKAYERSVELLEKKKNLAGVFTFKNMWSKMEGKYQTVCTPNVLKIYLMGELMERWNKLGGAQAVEAQTLEKERIINEFLSTQDTITHFVKDEIHRSKTVFALNAPEDFIAKIHENSSNIGMIIGKGYGKLKPTAFRVANFPAVTKENIEQLVAFLQKSL